MKAFTLLSAVCNTMVIHFKYLCSGKSITVIFYRKEMNKVFSFIALAFLGCGTVSAQQVNASNVQRPKLVVGIVVDQMRWDYLYRYQKRYGEGGFKRLLN